MPRCQRTFYRIREGRTEAGSGVTRWACPHCDDNEVYETVRDADLLHYRDLAHAYCTGQFGPPPDADRPTILLLGLRPECVYEADDKRYDLYLQRGSDPYQMRLQIGEEVFHRVCSHGRIFHWTHEMLACLTAVAVLRRCGMDWYARRVEREWEEDRKRLALEEMMQTDLWTTYPYPPGFYGRAYATGVALTEAVGWDHLRKLARRVNAAGVPDLEDWIAGLPPLLQVRVREVLRGTGAGGVE